MPSCEPGTSSAFCGDLEAIKHVVFVMMENRSFDHYFGVYRGVRGFDDHPARGYGDFACSWPQNTTSDPIGKLLPWHLDTARIDAECVICPNHDWDPTHEGWNQGHQPEFVLPQISRIGEPGAPVTMGYYTRQELGFYYALADAFTICDAYHSSVLGPTTPNRLMWISGSVDPDGQAGGPIISSQPFSWHTASWRTMPEVLQDAGVSWKYYNPAGIEFKPWEPLYSQFNLNPLGTFKQYEPSSELYRNAFDPTYDDWINDIRNNQLPEVSWIGPPARPAWNDHAPSTPRLGQWWLHNTLQVLWSNPEVWAQTVVFIMYDEGGMFFDHVQPPTAPEGTPGEWLTVPPATLPIDANQFMGPVGLGFRVPMLVVSPWSRGGYVCSDLFDHTSQLKFLQARFGVEIPNVSQWRLDTVGDLSSTLQLQRSDTSVPKMPDTPKDPPTVKEQCSADEIVLQIGGSTPQPPQRQSLPKQEEGGRRRVPKSV